MNKTKQLAELGILSAITVVLMVSSSFIPIIGNLLLLMLPAPVVYISLKQGLLHALAMSVVAAVIAIPLITPILALGCFVFSLGVGIAISLGLKYKLEPIITIFLVAVALIAILFAFDYFNAQITGISMKDFIVNTYQEVSDLNVKLFEDLKIAQPDMGTTIDKQIVQLKAITKNLIDAINLLFPSIVLVSGMFYGTLIYMVIGKVLRRLDLEFDIAYPKPFSTFSYPKHFAYGTAGMILLAYLVSYFKLVDSTLILSNFIFILSYLYSFQGVAVIYHFMLRKHKKGMAIFLTILMTIAIMGLLGQMILALFGFTDVLFNFRKFKRQER